MSYTYEVKKVRSKLVGHKSHLVIQTEDGRILDHLPKGDKGIKKASFLDRMTFRGTKVLLGGKKYRLKSKSLNSFLIRNGTRLVFDRYSHSIHLAVSRGFENAVRFIPRKGKSKREIRGLLILKCIQNYCNPSSSGPQFPYDDNPQNFKKNYRNSLKWEHFFIQLWNTKI